jgi:hypothetical protein
MKVQLAPDFPVTDEACKTATSKTFAEWFAVIETCPEEGRRMVIQWIYNETGRGKDVWWPTTIWVQYERSNGIVNKKDGLAEGYHICCTKGVKASAQAVYEAFTDGSKNDWLGCNSTVEGGAYTHDGGNEGTWLRLRPGKDDRIAWKTAGVETPTMVDAVFVEKDGKTGITVNHARIQDRDEADGLRKAWGDALNVLKPRLEAGA